MQAIDLHRVHIGDGVKKVVSFINDHHIPSQPYAHTIPCVSMEERVVWQGYQLSGWDPSSDTVIRTRFQLSAYPH